MCVHGPTTINDVHARVGESYSAAGVKLDSHTGAYLDFKSSGELCHWLVSTEFQEVREPFKEGWRAGFSVKGKSETSTWSKTGTFNLLANCRERSAPIAGGSNACSVSYKGPLTLRTNREQVGPLKCTDTLMKTGTAHSWP
ncbi:MAG: hypothetical protein Q9173_000749 [Seirophora scorigena]